MISSTRAKRVAAIPCVFQHGLKSVGQFGCFFGWVLVLGALQLGSRRLVINVVIHWLVILPALLQVLR